MTNNRINNLYPQQIAECRVTVEKMPDGTFRYEVRNDNGAVVDSGSDIETFNDTLTWIRWGVDETLEAQAEPIVFPWRFETEEAN